MEDELEGMQPPDEETDEWMNAPAGRPTVEQEHGPNPQPIVLQIAGLNDAIDAEIKKWGREIQAPPGMPPAHPGIISVDALALQAQMEALTLYLQRVVPNFDPYAFELEWKQRYLMTITNHRQMIVRNQSTQSIVQGIIGPDGKPVGS